MIKKTQISDSPEPGQKPTYQDLEEQVRVLEEKLAKCGRETEHIVEQRTAELHKANRRLRKEIKERKTTEQAFGENAKRGEALVNALPQTVFETDEIGNLTFSNRNAFVRFGYTQGDFSKGLNAFQMIAAEDREIAIKNMGRVMAGEDLGGVEYTALRKDGTTFPAVIYSNPILSGGHTVGLRGIMIDLTDYKRVEEELKKERDWAQLYLENAGVMFIALDVGGTVTLVNKKGCEILGYTESEILGKPWFDQFLSEDDRTAVKRVFQQIMAGDIESVEYFSNSILTKAGKERDIVWHNTVLTGEDGIIIGTFSSGEDITERKHSEKEKEKLEKQLQQAQKMEAIGTLAGGIAHDFNNILMTIIGYGEIMDMYDLPEGSPIRPSLKEVLKAAHRAKDLVHQILTFSRQTDGEKKPVRLGPIVQEALQFLRASLPSTIEIRREFETVDSTVMADSTQMHQVLMNLCTNAGYAMREQGGILEIGLEEVVLDKDAADRFVDLKPGAHLKLTVTDTGHGMDRRIMERIFDPFFTTKGRQGGTGMGLSVVHGIVRSHHGEITMESQPGKGSTFRVFLPLVPKEPAVPEIKDLSPLPIGHESILLVDDEASIVYIGEQTLGGLGYNMVCMTSSTEALNAFQADPGRFDLVITDLTMPNMTGVELARNILEIRPEIPIILCSGFSETVTSEGARNMGIREFLTKPLMLRELAESVRRVLDGGQGSR